MSTEPMETIPIPSPTDNAEPLRLAGHEFVFLAKVVSADSGGGQLLVLDQSEEIDLLASASLIARQIISPRLEGVLVANSVGPWIAAICSAARLVEVGFGAPGSEPGVTVFFFDGPKGSIMVRVMPTGVLELTSVSSTTEFADATALVSDVLLGKLPPTFVVARVRVRTTSGVNVVAERTFTGSEDLRSFVFNSLTNPPDGEDTA